MISSIEAARVVQKRILDNCSVEDEKRLLIGEAFFIKPMFCFCVGVAFVRFFFAYVVSCCFLKRLFWGKVHRISAKGQTVSYAFFSDKQKTPILVRSWSWYRDFRLRRHRKKSNNSVVLPPWQRLRIEAFAHFVLSQYGLAPALLTYSMNTGMLLREYAKGMSLEEIVEKGVWKKLNETEKTEILLKILRAIQKMHAIGVIHGDLAPGNILFLGESLEEVSFIDFENAWFSRKRVGYMSQKEMYVEEWGRMLERAESVDKDLYLKMRNFLEREEIV